MIIVSKLVNSNNLLSFTKIFTILKTFVRNSYNLNAPLCLKLLNQEMSLVRVLEMNSKQDPRFYDSFPTRANKIYYQSINQLINFFQTPMLVQQLLVL